MKKYHPSVLFVLCISLVYSQNTLIQEYELSGADAYELPSISPDNNIFMIMASKEYVGTYYLQCNLDDKNDAPDKLFNVGTKKKKKKKGKKSKLTMEESLVGWLSYGGTQYLYSVRNKTSSNPIVSTMYSFPFGDEDQGVLEEFQTSIPNTPNVSQVLNDAEGIIISFLNGPYGYYHYVFDEEGAVISTPTIFDLPGPVQSISQWSNHDILILEGKENIYHLWSSNSGDNWEPSRLNVDLSDYTIFGSINCHPEYNDIFSFLASTVDRMKMNKADLCIYDLKRGLVIKTIEVYAPSEPYLGTEYSQWSKKYNRLYFLRQNEKEHIQSFHYDVDTDRILVSGIPDIRIKSFSMSAKGDRLATIAYPDGGHVRVYSIDE